MRRIDQYIDDALDRKNRGVYFKKGKWLLHVLIIIVFWAASYSRLETSFRNTTISASVNFDAADFFIAVIMSLPFLAFFYTYCLYLVPRCFKRNHYRRFWVGLVLLLIIGPLISFFLELFLARHFSDLAASHRQVSWLVLLRNIFWSFISSFIGFTSMLYLMELMEGIRTVREIDETSYQLLLTERNQIKTRMDPGFMMRSLDGIIHLEEEQQELAPDAVVRFSDVLRYRLYRSAEKWVPLSEELQHLDNLFRFNNTLPGKAGSSTLEVQGGVTDRLIQPLSLVNIAEALLNTDTGVAGNDWSLLLYLLPEQESLQIAAELTGAGPDTETIVAGLRQNLQSIFGDQLIFAIERELNAFSISICLPLHNSSNA